MHAIFKQVPPLLLVVKWRGTENGIGSVVRQLNGRMEAQNGGFMVSESPLRIARLKCICNSLINEQK